MIRGCYKTPTTALLLIHFYGLISASLRFNGTLRGTKRALLKINCPASPLKKFANPTPKPFQLSRVIK
jgi:hypothetical protein